MMRWRRAEPRAAPASWAVVAHVGNQSEGEMLVDILRQEGIPGFMRRQSWIDVPDMLAGGPRDVLVPASDAERARAVLKPLDGDDE